MKWTILYKHNYSNNVLHGDFVEYFKDGQESLVGNYKAGTKHGKWTWNYQDGLVALTGGFKNDIPIGTWKTTTAIDYLQQNVCKNRLCVFYHLYATMSTFHV